LTIGLQVDDYSDRSTIFGISELASDGLDKMDYRKPRAISEFPCVQMLRPQWVKKYTNFCRDMRRGGAAVESWDFDVVAPNNENLQLSISDIEALPVDADIYLLDKNGGKYYDLRLEPQVAFRPIKRISPFTIYVGDSEQIMEKMSQLIPGYFVLEQNYPNPFNPNTTIRFALPNEEKVSLIIYNLLGQQIRALINNKQYLSGYHSIMWDGRNDSGKKLASGLYIYDLKAGTFSEKKKMILLK
jgi:hypothetical protein